MQSASKSMIKVTLKKYLVSGNPANSQFGCHGCVIINDIDLYTRDKSSRGVVLLVAMPTHIIATTTVNNVLMLNTVDFQL